MPAEPTQRQREGQPAPGAEDGDGSPLIVDDAAIEDHGPQGVVELREGQRLDDGLDGVGKAVRSEKHAGQDYSAEDLAAQDAMRRRWIVDQMLIDPFAKNVIPYEVRTFQNYPPTVKY